MVRSARRKSMRMMVPVKDGRKRPAKSTSQVPWGGAVLIAAQAAGKALPEAGPPSQLAARRRLGRDIDQRAACAGRDGAADPTHLTAQRAGARLDIFALGRGHRAGAFEGALLSATTWAGASRRGFVGIRGGGGQREDQDGGETDG